MRPQAPAPNQIDATSIDKGLVSVFMISVRGRCRGRTRSASAASIHDVSGPLVFRLPGQEEEAIHADAHSNGDDPQRDEMQGQRVSPRGAPCDHAPAGHDEEAVRASSERRTRLQYAFTGPPMLRRRLATIRDGTAFRMRNARVAAAPVRGHSRLQVGTQPERLKQPRYCDCRRPTAQPIAPCVEAAPLRTRCS
jgi:hypothetical protein